MSGERLGYREDTDDDDWFDREVKVQGMSFRIDRVEDRV
jgi:hypothetical protein